MSESVVRSDAACCPVANSAAYSASPALATTHGIIVENTWMDPLILVGSFLLPRKKIAPATDLASKVGCVGEGVEDHVAGVIEQSVLVISATIAEGAVCCLEDALGWLGLL
jgi:hypothetical protein